MSARHKARKRALDILFEAQLRDLDPLEVLQSRLEQPDAALNPYTETLVRGVCANRADLDDTISQYSRGWEIDRMPVVDACILRMAVYELAHELEVPGSVVLSEAVELASDLSTDESAGFVNGVLARIAAAVPGRSLPL
ncbi:MAG: transcription antitermination factor NusB [Actinomycetales bacterium]|nr:transcription antitermination factor NusB [Actinomycetales bacterium]